MIIWICTIHRFNHHIAMPEGPEVRRTRDVLHSKLAGRRFHGITVNSRSRYAKSGHLPGDQYLTNGDVGCGTGIISEPGVGVTYTARGTFLGVESRGKKLLLWVKLDCGRHIAMVSFLGMEGHWQYAPGSHSGIEISLGRLKKVGTTQLDITDSSVYYDDSRHFGFLKVLATEPEIADCFKDTGPDLLSGLVTLEAYIAKITNVKLSGKQIVWFMMEQKYFSGVGNYLKSEILYAARISPHRLLGDLSVADVKLLYDTTISILNESYSKNGLTIASYRDPDGVLGTYEPKVYQQAFDADANPVETMTLTDKRTTHWVPALQK